MDWTIALILAVALGAVALLILRARKTKAPRAPKVPKSEQPEPALDAARPAEAPARRLPPPVEGDLTVVAPGGRASARIHYLIAGPQEADAPPVALIHGLGGSIRHFSSTLIPELARERRVVAFDRPGYGLSTRPPEGGAAHLADQAAILRSAMLQLGVQRPVLVGHSFGGGVALAYALDHPDDVSGVALLAPSVFPFRMKPPLPDNTVDSPAMRWTLAYTVGPLMARKNAESTLAAAFGPQTPPSDYSTEGGGAYALRPSQLEAMMEDGSILRPDLAELAPRYGALKAPVAMLFGMADQILTYEDHGPPLKRAAPHVTLKTLDGVGHMLPFVEPQACLDIIRQVSDSPEARRRWRSE